MTSKETIELQSNKLSPISVHYPLPSHHHWLPWYTTPWWLSEKSSPWHHHTLETDYLSFKQTGGWCHNGELEEIAIIHWNKEFNRCWTVRQVDKFVRMLVGLACTGITKEWEWTGESRICRGSLLRLVCRGCDWMKVSKLLAQ